jgi:type IV secretion system protein VirB5
LYAAAPTANAALKIAVVSMGIVTAVMALALMKTSAAATHVRPCIVRINEVGRAEAVSYQPISYRPQAPEIRYFLSHFTHDYFARVHATLRHDYMIAQWFPDRQLFQQADDRDRRTQWLPKFLSGTEDDAEVTVSDVVIENLEQEPYRARVEFSKVFTSSAGQETAAEDAAHNTARSARERNQVLPLTGSCTTTRTAFPGASRNGQTHRRRSGFRSSKTLGKGSVRE